MLPISFKIVLLYEKITSAAISGRGLNEGSRVLMFILIFLSK